MGISKVEINNADGTKNVLVDLTGDTVTADMLAKGVTAHGADGELITGTMKAGIDTSDATATPTDIRYNKTAYVKGEKITGDLRDAGNIVFSIFSKIKDYPSSNCIYVCGTKDSDSNYVCTNTTLGEAKAPYSEFGDAIAEDVAKGKTFTSADGFKVIGTAEAIVSNDNCEAYHITDKSTALNFKRTDGDIKVWGYGYHSQSTYQKTTYAFVGDGYYTASYYGTPSKTSKTFGINSDGTLSGLPSNLTKVDLLVTKGV